MEVNRWKEPESVQFEWRVRGCGPRIVRVMFLGPTFMYVDKWGRAPFKFEYLLVNLTVPHGGSRDFQHLQCLSFGDAQNSR